MGSQCVERLSAQNVSGAGAGAENKAERVRKSGEREGLEKNTVERERPER